MGHYALDLVDLQQKCDNFNRSSWSFLLSKQKERKRHKSSLTNNFYGHEKWCHINENAWKNLHCSIPFRYVTLRSIQNVLWELSYIYTYFPCITFMTGPIRIESYGRYNKFRGYQRHPTIFMTITVAKVPCVCREWVRVSEWIHTWIVVMH